MARRGLGVPALVALGASLTILLTSASAGAASTRDRAVTDMPDDISGPQVHFLYVVPSDGADGQLDTNGVMEQSIARIENWVVTQTGNQALKVDTYKGVPDITFFRLPRSDAQATEVHPWPIWAIGEDLVAAGFNDPAKVYAALYDGRSIMGVWRSEVACPAEAGCHVHPRRGQRTIRAHVSDAPGFGTGTDRPGYFEIGLLHEVMHVTRVRAELRSPRERRHLAKSCQRQPNGPHVRSRRDKSPAGWDWSSAVLDFNHDDYYRAHIPGCPDFSDSPYLMPLHSVSVTASGPGTVTSAPAGIDCPG